MVFPKLVAINLFILGSLAASHANQDCNDGATSGTCTMNDRTAKFQSHGFSLLQMAQVNTSVDKAIEAMTSPEGLVCESWCAGDARNKGTKCNLDGCAGCEFCGPAWPEPADKEYPEPLTMNYKDWECVKICKARSELQAPGGSGCCVYTKSTGACQFAPGGTVKQRGWKADFLSWQCTSDEYGGGKCGSTRWGRTCEGGTPETALEPAPAPGPASSFEGLVLDWSDEFNECPEGKPDPSMWSYELVQRSNRLQWYTEENAHCVNGALVITARHESPVAAGVAEQLEKRGSGGNQVTAAFFQYTSSSLTSKGKKSFVLGGRGKAEIRAKVDIRSGGFPAWWIMGESDDFDPPCSWPGCGEIDIMEYAGASGWIKTNFCVPQGGDARCTWGTGCECKWNSRSTAVDENWEAQWHTWTFEWDEEKDSMHVLLDGASYNRQTFSSAEPSVTGRGNTENTFRGKRQYMILNLAIGFVGGDPTPTTFPMKLEVDYVRVYKAA